MSDLKSKNEAIITQHLRQYEEDNKPLPYNPRVAKNLDEVRVQQANADQATAQKLKGMPITNSVESATAKAALAGRPDGSSKLTGGKKIGLAIVAGSVLTLSAAAAGVLRYVLVQQPTNAGEPIRYTANVENKSLVIEVENRPHVQKQYIPPELQTKSIGVSEGILKMMENQLKTHDQGYDPLDMKRDLRQLAKDSADEFVFYNGVKYPLNGTDSSIDLAAGVIGFKNSRKQVLGDQLVDDIKALSDYPANPTISSAEAPPPTSDNAQANFRANENARREQAQVIDNANQGRKFN